MDERRSTDGESPHPPITPQSAGDRTPSPGDDLVTAVACMSEFEAATKVAVLAEAGIEAFVFGAAHSALPLNQKFLNVPVQVRAADLERARAVLSENRAEAPSIDWDSVDLGEREDDLPLRGTRRMPWPVKIGLMLAMVIVVGMLAFAAWIALAAFGPWPSGG